ncbi:hypothetical protein DFH06DRAFT_1170283 [Mycena polygramma]|nr:hypothetical protein DFH06DRAFT_1170283 [Mycena polygramma]
MAMNGFISSSYYASTGLVGGVGTRILWRASCSCPTSFKPFVAMWLDAECIGDGLITVILFMFTKSLALAPVYVLLIYSQGFRRRRTGFPKTDINIIVDRTVITMTVHTSLHHFYLRRLGLDFVSRHT